MAPVSVTPKISYYICSRILQHSAVDIKGPEIISQLLFSLIFETITYLTTMFTPSHSQSVSHPGD